MLLSLSLSQVLPPILITTKQRGKRKVSTFSNLPGDESLIVLFCPLLFTSFFYEFSSRFKTHTHPNLEPKNVPTMNSSDPGRKIFFMKRTLFFHKKDTFIKRTLFFHGIVGKQLVVFVFPLLGIRNQISCESNKQPPLKLGIGFNNRENDISKRG